MRIFYEFSFTFQAEILKKFNQQMKAFQFEEEELGKEEEENLNPFLESGELRIT